jgi:hypothetical protein
MSSDAPFFKSLPKIEVPTNHTQLLTEEPSSCPIQLHAHLSGSISRACLHDIWLQKRPKDLADPLVAIPLGKVDYDLTTFVHILFLPVGTL